jgi:hypothetical protein
VRLFRLIECMLLISEGLVKLLTSKKDRGKFVKNQLLWVIMSGILVIMYHIELCTPCIAHFNVTHLLHILVDHAEPKSENQAEQVQWVFRLPQASI